MGLYEIKQCNFKSWQNRSLTCVYIYNVKHFKFKLIMKNHKKMKPGDCSFTMVIRSVQSDPGGKKIIKKRICKDQAQSWK